MALLSVAMRKSPLVTVTQADQSPQVAETGRTAVLLLSIEFGAEVSVRGTGPQAPFADLDGRSLKGATRMTLNRSADFHPDLRRFGVAPQASGRRRRCESSGCSIDSARAVRLTACRCWPYHRGALLARVHHPSVAAPSTDASAAVDTRRRVCDGYGGIR